MIKTVEIKLDAPDGIKLTQSTGSVLHGVLMEHLPQDYGEELHRQALRPYSQYLFFDKNRQELFWRLTTLTETAEAIIQEAIMALPAEISLKSKGINLTLLSKEVIVDTSYSKLAEKYFANSLKGDLLNFNFLTSCSFKTEGNYAIYPQPNLLFTSLVNKWNSFSDKEKLDSKGVAAELAQEVYVADYRLRLQRFSVDGASIPGFRGLYALGMRHNLMANRIIAMLGEFANYSGIGIKTALGMGAVSSILAAKK